MAKHENHMLAMWDLLHKIITENYSHENIEGLVDYNYGVTAITSGAIFRTKHGGYYCQVNSRRYGRQEFFNPELDKFLDKNWYLSGLDQETLSDSFEDLQIADQADVDIDLEEEYTPGLILKVLSDPTSSLQDRRQAIFNAESCDFVPEREQDLMTFLLDFIVSFRDSNNPEELLAVGSAIRKYVAAMDLADVGVVSSFLEPTHRYSLPLEIEMELMKMVFRKFAANPPETPDSFPQLSDQVFEVASAYLNPRVLRDMHATIAMNAAQALVAMCSKHASIILAQVKELPFTWFKQQLYRRLNNLQAEWQKKLSSDHSAGRFLDALLSQGEL